MHQLFDIKIAQIIGADSLGYLSLDGAKKMACGGDGSGYCTACFDGIYPTPTPSASGKNRFERRLSQREKDEE